MAIGRLEISWTGNGTVWLDEASLMPSDNVDGVRKEYFDLYKEWQPGVLRYPGGCFADRPSNHCEFGIGPIDKRQSPNWAPAWSAYQRRDFGTDEFVVFCKACNIEPHMTVNFGSGTVEEAAALVEYCNGPSNSTYGAMRTANGHPEPYNVKYWEIGNEQYGNWEIGHTTPENYGARFVEYYHAMKAVDPTIRIMADGDTDPNWYGPMMSAIGNDIDIFGWHNCDGIEKSASDKAIYLAMLAGSQNTERTIESFWDEANDTGLAPEMRLSISEWWPVYRYSSESATRIATLESALWSALHLNTFQRHGDAMETACRTSFIGVIISTINTTTWERAIFGSPTYHVFQMYRKHSGTRRLDVNVDCPMYDYDTLGVPWMPGEKNVPYLDASATRSNDSIYLTVVNRHPTDAIQSELSWTGIQPINGVIHEISSESYLDANTMTAPIKITPHSYLWEPDKSYTFPPHSVTIIEITNYTQSPSVDIVKPSQKTLYLFDREIIPLPRNTVTIGKITIEVTAYDENGIDMVEFYIDDELKYVDEEMPYEWLWNEKVMGRHEIKAIAYDNTGHSAIDDITV